MTTMVDAPGSRAHTPVAERIHPLHRFAARLHALIDEVSDAATFSLTADETVETLGELYAALPRLAERTAAVLAHADTCDVATSHGTTSTAAWVAETTRSTRGTAHRDLRAATALAGGGHEPVRGALAAGALTVEQGRVVITAVDRLPGSVGPQERERAERHLVAEAAVHDAHALERLGRHLVDVIDPDGADARLAALLEAEEKRAARSTWLSLHDDGEGRCHGRFTVSSLHGAMLTTALQAIANPALADPVSRRRDDGSAATGPEVLGQAFARLVEHYPLDRLPSTGGVNATVLVTMSLETLEGRLGTAQVLGTDLRLSPGAARRLACRAGVVPAVLGTDSVVLDLGRRTRLHTKAQRHALALQQQGRCAADRCITPATWCDAHHLIAWSAGGSTTVADGALLCPRHHTLAHDPRLTATRLGTGKLAFHRRT